MAKREVARLWQGNKTCHLTRQRRYRLTLFYRQKRCSLLGRVGSFTKSATLLWPRTGLNEALPTPVLVETVNQANEQSVDVKQYRLFTGRDRFEDKLEL